jgi:hypothetical protein
MQTPPIALLRTDKTYRLVDQDQWSNPHIDPPTIPNQVPNPCSLPLLNHNTHSLPARNQHAAPRHALVSPPLPYASPGRQRASRLHRHEPRMHRSIRLRVLGQQQWLFV